MTHLCLWPLLQIAGIVDHERSYPFGPKLAPCHKRLVLRDGYHVERRMPCTVRQGMSAAGWGGTVSQGMSPCARRSW